MRTSIVGKTVGIAKIMTTMIDDNSESGNDSDDDRDGSDKNTYGKRSRFGIDVEYADYTMLVKWTLHSS